MYPDLRYAIQYYQALDNCQFMACPDVAPAYEGFYAGLIVISIGIIILVFAQVKGRRHIEVNDMNS